MARHDPQDDDALLAMQTARMSLDSIAATMGWSRRRVEARLAQLAEPKVRPLDLGDLVGMVDQIRRAPDEAGRRQQVYALRAGLALDGISVAIAGIPREAARQRAASRAALGLLLADFGRDLFRGLRAEAAFAGIGRLVEGLPRLAWRLVRRALEAILVEIPRAAVRDAEDRRLREAAREAIADPARVSAAVETMRANLAEPPRPLAAHRRTWTADEDALLTRVWRSEVVNAAETAARLLGRKIPACRARAKELSLRRPDIRQRIGGEGAARVRTCRTPPLVEPAERRGVVFVRPLTPRRRRYCRWFHEAAWEVDEIAALFDVAGRDLAEALGVAG